jgi:hypothetical protein
MSPFAAMKSSVLLAAHSGGSNQGATFMIGLPHGNDRVKLQHISPQPICAGHGLCIS